MSQSHQSEHRNSDPQEPLVWGRVTWRQGDGRYVFEIEEGGLVAKLSSPHGTSLTLPVVAWEGLLDALAGARKTRARGERAFPARSGARWYDGESGELAASFKAGRTIPQLARAHNRSEYAVEAQLDRMGLWDRVARRPILASAELAQSQKPFAGRDRTHGGPAAIPFTTDRD